MSSGGFVQNALDVCCEISFECGTAIRTNFQEYFHIDLPDVVDQPKGVIHISNNRGVVDFYGHQFPMEWAVIKWTPSINT